MSQLGQTNVMDFSAALAADLAADLYSPEEVFRSHGVDPEVGQALLEQDWFAAMVRTAKRDWEAIDNVRDRIRTKAQITLEESLPIIYALIADRNTPGAARVAAFKEIKEVAGMGLKDQEGVGPTFVPVQIFLDGREQPPVTIGIPPVLEVEDATEVTPEQSPEPEEEAVPENNSKLDAGFILGMDLGL